MAFSSFRQFLSGPLLMLSVLASNPDNSASPDA